MENDTSVPAVNSSSQRSSTSQIEKEQTLGHRVSRNHLQTNDEKKHVETTPLDEAKALETLSDEPDYPSGAKL